MSDFKKRLESAFEKSAQAAAEKAEKEAAAQKERQEIKDAAERLFDERVIPSITVLSQEASSRGLQVSVRRSDSTNAQGWVRVEVRSGSTYKSSGWSLTAHEMSRSITTELKLNTSDAYDKSPVTFDEVTEEWVQAKLERLYTDILNTTR